MAPNSEPCVFIYGPEATVVGTIIHYLAGAQAERHTLSELAVCYWPWRVDNKYYSADVRLCHVQRHGLPPDERLAQSCEAVIICFNPQQANGLAEVDAILSLTRELEPDVCLLVCETCSGDTAVSRLRAQEWCVGHGFELVELAPAEEADPHDDFPETTGVQRISQALHAHTWSNLQMKHHQPAISSKLVDDLTAERVRDNSSTSGSGGPVTSGSGEPSPVSQQVTAEDQQTSASVDTLVTELVGLMGSGSSGGDGGADGDGDGDGDEGGDGDEDAAGLEDFELLFSQLAELRAAAARAPADQRHELAERVAMAFLRSMGADEDVPGEDSD